MTTLTLSIDISSDTRGCGELFRLRITPTRSQECKRAESRVHTETQNAMNGDHDSEFGVEELIAHWLY